jgi:Rps23 Pro-64 3,4-dihydroxylase Tpa1-like proline 4-hydroxylase
VDWQIDPKHDPAVLHSTLVEKGRLQIPNFLTPQTAESLHTLLVNNNTWFTTYNHGGEHSECPAEDIAKLSQQHRNQFFVRTYQEARSGFQFIFNQYAITTAIESGENTGHPLHHMHDFVNSDHFLNYMRTLTGRPEIAKSDSYASQYLPGHFLTSHDDLHSTEQRIAAYTISLTKNWREDWGGHLVFFDQAGNIEEGYKPSFNTLNIFFMPKMHSVQYVSPFAGTPRTSFLGWLKQ